MNNLTFYNENEKKYYRRITKASAKNAFINGKTVVFCPSNLRPFGFWNCGVKIDINSENCQFEISCGDDPRGLFEKLVNSFYFYNCTNAETGRRVNFYIADN